MCGSHNWWCRKMGFKATPRIHVCRDLTVPFRCRVVTKLKWQFRATQGYARVSGLPVLIQNIDLNHLQVSSPPRVRLQEEEAAIQLAHWEIPGSRLFTKANLEESNNTMHVTIWEYYMQHSLPNLAGVVAINRSFQLYDCIEGFPRVFVFLVHRNRRCDPV